MLAQCTLKYFALRDAKCALGNCFVALCSCLLIARAHFRDSAIVGIFNSLNGLFIIFGSPADRTPPLIQAVLGNMTIFFSYPLTRWLMNERRTIRDWRPISALVLLSAGIVISLWPEFTSTVNNSGGSVAWSVLFLVGMAPSTTCLPQVAFDFATKPTPYPLSINVHSSAVVFFTYPLRLSRNK